MLKKIQIDEYICEGVENTASDRVAYMIYPHVDGFTTGWLEDMSSKFGISIVMVYVALERWNNDLTPWPEPPESKGFQPFAGDAPEFYRELTEKIIPQAEKTLGLVNVAQRDLIGVSLSGLFSLWQWMQFDTFTSIGCLSGSFWYDGFIDWFENQTISQKNGKAFFLLGTEEPKARIKAYQSVGVNTEAIFNRLSASGIECRFDWVPGNHFANAGPRAEKALEYLYNKNN